MHILSACVLGGAALFLSTAAHAIEPVWVVPGSATGSNLYVKELLDAEGDLFVVSNGWATGSTIRTVSIDRRDPDGLQLFYAEHELLSPGVTLKDAVLDNTGNLWVSGSTQTTSTAGTGFIAAFDGLTGDPVFEALVPGNATSTWCGELAVDTLGRVAVACTDLLDTMVRVYTPGFDLAWSARLTAITRSQLSPGVSGELYVGGTERLSITPPLYDDAVARFSVNGSKLWQKRNGVAGNQEFMFDMVTTANGEVITAGTTCPPSPTPCQLYSLRLKRSNGATKWTNRSPLTQTLGATQSNLGRANVQLGPDGDAVYALYEYDTNANVLMLRVNGGTGATVWTQRVLGALHQMDLDADGNAWVVQYWQSRFLYQYSYATGAVMNTLGIQGQLTKVLVDDAAARVYLAGTESGMTLIGAYE